MTYENMKESIEKFKNNDLDEYFISEPLPLQNDGPILKVVGKNYE